MKFLSVQSAAIVIAAALGAVGCARDQAKTEPSTTSGTASASGTTGTTGTGETAQVGVGKPPPDFTAKAHDGTEVHLAALKGKPVVIYFYPKDETPGCTAEACSFRDAWDELSKKGVVMIGISGDDDASHKKFAEHHKLPFLLVSDPDGKIAKQFGVPFTAGFAKRQTFVIDANGNVKKIYRSVDVSTHAKEIAGDVG
jgi:peroxiredoxin Q/BCP